MTYCDNCGTLNDDGAMYCKKCGRALAGPTAEPGRQPSPTRRHMEDECFGLPHGGSIIGVIIGVLIILVGLSWFLGFNFWNNIWYVLIIILGILIVAGAAYRGTRR